MSSSPREEDMSHFHPFSENPIPAGHGFLSSKRKWFRSSRNVLPIANAGRIERADRSARSANEPSLRRVSTRANATVLRIIIFVRCSMFASRGFTEAKLARDAISLENRRVIRAHRWQLSRVLHSTPIAVIDKSLRPPRSGALTVATINRGRKR